MQCPSCGAEITEKDKICPKCRKVLRLECPICSTLNTRKVCEKCGYVIISKCAKCSKINPTINKTCANCGTSTFASVLVNTSKLEEFAVLTFDFVNLDKISWSMGDKRFKKFYDKLKSAIKNIVKTKELTIIKDGSNYVIGFNKDDSFSESVENAIKVSFRLLALVAKINLKITKYSNEVLKCAATISKMASYSDNIDVISFLDLYKDDKKKISALTDVHLYLEAQIYSVLQDKLEYTYISSVYKNKKEVMLFNINAKKYIDIYDDPQLKGQKMVDGRYNLPEFKEDLSYLKVIQDRNAFNKNLINFTSIKCNWEKLDGYQLKEKLFSLVIGEKKFILSCSAPYEYTLPEKEIIQLFEPAKEKTIQIITCSQDMKDIPYGFWRKMLERIYNLSNLSEKELQDVYKYQIGLEDRNNLLRFVMNFEELKNSNPSQVNEEISKSIFNLIKNQTNKVFYIKNFEYMDETSKLIFEQLINNFDSLPLSWVVELNHPQKLHDIFKPLLVNPKYFEVTMLPMPFNKIIQPYLPKYEAVTDSFYINRTALCAKGSLYFVDTALSYLKEKEIFVEEKSGIRLNSQGNLIIPATLDDLIKKRITALMDYPQVFDIFAVSLLFDDCINMKYLSELFSEYKFEPLFKYLTDNGYLYKNGTNFYIAGYNLYLKMFKDSIPEEKTVEIAQRMLKSTYINKNKALKVKLHELCGNKIDALNEITQNIDINSSLGDYYALLHSIRYFLYLIKKYEISDNDEGIREKKEAIFSELISNARHFNPDSISDIIAVIANKLKKESQIIDLINVYLNIFDSCLNHQNYVNGFQYLQKIFSLIQNSQEAQDKFSNILPILSILKIDLLFNLGYFKSAINSGMGTINEMTAEYIAKIKHTVFLDKPFEELLNILICDLTLMLILDHQTSVEEFSLLLEEKLKRKIPAKELFEALEKLVMGKAYTVQYKEIYGAIPFTAMLYHILNAFLKVEEPEEFANRLYSASLISSQTHNNQIEYFCALLIAYSYTKLSNNDKSRQIIKIIQEKSAKQNLSTLSYLTCYFDCLNESADEGKLPSVLDTLSSLLQKIESDDNVCLFLNVMFKKLMGTMLELSGNTKQAAYYFETAKEMLK
ncbi:zinc ribbon domain-containing protein [bacterium]|nr:zinc ribbon domain-containing protein [bacterium]